MKYRFLDLYPRRRQMRCTLGAAGVIGAVLLSAAAQAQDFAKIGLILTYSGQFADLGAQIDNGVRLFIKQHGDAAGGRKIEIIRKDDGGPDPSTAQRLAQELLVRDGVNVIAGFVFTPNALAAAPISEKAKKLMVVMNAAAKSITSRSPYTVRTSLVLSDGYAPIGEWAARHGVKRLFTMVSDYAPGHDAEAAVLESYKRSGGAEVVGSIRMPLANPDFSPFVQRAKDANPDGIFIFEPGGSQSIALANALREHDVDPKKIRVMGGSDIVTEEALKVFGDAGIGIVTAVNYDSDLSFGMNKEFVDAYKVAFDRNPDAHSVGGYDGMRLIYQALTKTAGKADGESLVAAAKGAAWESPRGSVSIDPETREMIQTVYIRRLEKVDGRLRNVTIDEFRISTPR